MKWRLFPTPIPTDRYEVVGRKWTMTGYGREKGEVLEKQMKKVTSLKIVIKLFLPFSIKI
jgi:hypothetical protein